MQFSTFGSKYLGDCGILQLMDDLGKAVQSDDVIMLGGGNPSHLPQVQEIFRSRGWSACWTPMPASRS